MALDAGEIHLWLAFYDEINDPVLLTAYLEILSDQERSQEFRFYFANDRKRFRITRALVRTVLSRYVHVDPKAWRFSNNVYGRPEVANDLVCRTGLSFSISHSHSLIVLAVARGRALGIDVENVISHPAPIEIADSYFAPDEINALSALPPERRQDRFFEYWTFKECYIKARGMGLSIPLDKFWFNYQQCGSVTIQIDSDLFDDAARWQFWQFRPRPEYLVAVCAERLGSSTPIVTIRRVVPLRMEEEITLRFTRTS